MTTKAAREFARKARKAAPPGMYDFVRTLEKAIEALADELDSLKVAGGAGAIQREHNDVAANWDRPRTR